MGSTSTGHRTSGTAALIAAVGTLLLLVLGPVATAHAAGDDADITVGFGCDSVETTSSKDISNVVVSFADGSTEKFDGLSGHSWSREFGRAVAGVWVKSGDNASGEGPGYGEWFPSEGDCDEQPAPAQQPDTGTEDVATDDVVETPAGSTGADAPAAEVLGETDSDTDPAEVADEVAPAPDTAVLGVTIDRPVAAAGPDAQVAGIGAGAAPTSLALTGSDAGWLLALAVALSVYGIIALDLTGRRAGG